MTKKLEWKGIYEQALPYEEGEYLLSHGYGIEFVIYVPDKNHPLVLGKWIYKYTWKEVNWNFLVTHWCKVEIVSEAWPYHGQ